MSTVSSPLRPSSVPHTPVGMASPKKIIREQVVSTTEVSYLSKKFGIYYTRADERAKWLGIQQVVGTATVIQNAYLLASDVSTLFYDYMTQPEDGKAYLTRKDKIQITLLDLKKHAKNENDPVFKEHLKSVENSITPNIPRRITYIAIGCIRGTPGLGSIWSYAASKLLSKEAD